MEPSIFKVTPRCSYSLSFSSESGNGCIKDFREEGTESKSDPEKTSKRDNKSVTAPDPHKSLPSMKKKRSKALKSRCNSKGKGIASF